MPVLVFICAAIVFGGLYLAALQLGFLIGKRKYDPFKGKDPEEMTVQEIYDTMTDPQKIVCSYLVGEAMDWNKKGEDHQEPDKTLDISPKIGMGWDKINRIGDYYKEEEE